MQQVEIILLEKIGNRAVGTIARVKRGFANYLVRFGKAKRATKQAKIDFEAEKATLLKRAEEKLEEAKVQAEKMQGLVLTLTQQAGVDGRLFGSVGNGDIAVVLATTGFEIPKINIRLPNGPLKTVGSHTVLIALHADVLVDVQVQIIGETN